MLSPFIDEPKIGRVTLNSIGKVGGFKKIFDRSKGTSAIVRVPNKQLMLSGYDAASKKCIVLNRLTTIAADCKRGRSATQLHKYEYYTFKNEYTFYSPTF